MGGKITMTTTNEKTVTNCLTKLTDLNALATRSGKKK